MGEDSPANIDYRKKGTLTLTSLLEDLVMSHVATETSRVAHLEQTDPREYAGSRRSGAASFGSALPASAGVLPKALQVQGPRRFVSLRKRLLGCLGVLPGAEMNMVYFAFLVLNGHMFFSPGAEANARVERDRMHLSRSGSSFLCHKEREHLSKRKVFYVLFSGWTASLGCTLLSGVGSNQMGV